MTELHADLLSVLDAVVIHSPVCFAVCGQIHELSGQSRDDISTEAARERAMVAAIRNDIYKYL